MILLLGAAAAIYIVTFVTWLMYGKRFYNRRNILTANAFIAGFYIICFALKGDSPCGADYWFCTKWYEEVMFFGFIHLVLFWVFMIIQLLLELFFNPYKTPKP